MVNPIRGEITAILDDKPYTLCLTLGALASLENKLGAENLAALSKKFADGSLSSKDLIAIIEAGLEGGGNDVSTLDVSAMKVKGAVNGFVDIAARLLEATFTPLAGEQQ